MRRVLLGVSFCLLMCSTWLGLTKGQIEGAVRNILYAHVPSSVCSLLCFTVLLVASIGYLITSRPSWDLVARASAEVGTVFATILNATGMIFARAEWGVWWTASPRLVTSAILWFLYIVYLILRQSIPGSERRRGRICAVFGILAFLDVPMVYISARFIPDYIHRASFSFDTNWQRAALMTGMFGTMLLAAAMIWLRTELLGVKARLEDELIA
jgi:heme exporter protein C